MRSKLQEQSLIWENYMTDSPFRDDDEDDSMEYDEIDYSDSFDDDDGSFEDYGDEGDAKGVVMSFDTSEPVEIDHDEDHGDHENTERDDMIRSELLKLVEFTTKLQDMAKDADFEEWMAAKITKASDYVTDVYFRLATKADYANCGCGD